MAIQFYFSRSSDSSTRTGSAGNRGSSTGSSAANSNSPTTPATAALSSSVRVKRRNSFTSAGNYFEFVYNSFCFRLHKRQKNPPTHQAVEMAKAMRRVARLLHLVRVKKCSCQTCKISYRAYKLATMAMRPDERLIWLVR